MISLEALRVSPTRQFPLAIRHKAQALLGVVGLVVTASMVSALDSEHRAQSLFMFLGLLSSIGMILSWCLSRQLKAFSDEYSSAQSANRAKSFLLASTNHEIRSPLQLILGYIEVLKEDISREERIKYLSIIERAGLDLSKIADDILDLSKAEAGYVEVNIEEVDVRLLLEVVRNFFSIQLAQRRNSLEIRMSPTVPEKIYTDRLRLKQILINLIANANKFTDRGRISIHVDLKDDLLELQVMDTGSGLTPEQSEKLFGLYAQAHGDTKRKLGGSGLGLILSKKWANVLGGDLILKCSAPQVGSVFLLTIRPEQVEALPA